MGIKDRIKSSSVARCLVPNWSSPKPCWLRGSALKRIKRRTPTTNYSVASVRPGCWRTGGRAAADGRPRAPAHFGGLCEVSPDGGRICSSARNASSLRQRPGLGEGPRRRKARAPCRIRSVASHPCTECSGPTQRGKPCRHGRYSELRGNNQSAISRANF
jgi:hypothetical protein